MPNSHSRAFGFGQLIHYATLIATPVAAFSFEARHQPGVLGRASSSRRATDGMRRACHATLLALVCGCSPTAARLEPAVPSADSALFVIRIGNDTSRYMWLIRDGRRITTTSANRIPTLRLIRGYTILGDDWSVSQLEQVTTDPSAPTPTAPLAQTRIWRTGDSTIVETGLPPNARRIAYEGGGHFINTPHYFETLALIGGVPAVGDSLVGQHFAGSLFPPQRFVVRRLSHDRATASSRPLGTIRMTLGARGEVIEFDGAGTSALNFTGARVPWRDVDVMVAELQDAERRGRRFGALSGRDSVHVVAAGADIRVDYGRPTRRGREIFGYIVPFDSVWRTGANRSTHFTTSRALDFGGSLLPPGSYTMWTLPTRTGWSLIFNGQTGQWGTEYDRARDVLRVPMIVTQLPDAVEQFTITVDSQANGGVLRLAWDRTEARVSFVVR